jgi:hypothetical protein
MYIGDSVCVGRGYIYIWYGFQLHSHWKVGQKSGSIGSDGCDCGDGGGPGGGVC